MEHYRTSYAESINRYSNQKPGNHLQYAKQQLSDRLIEPLFKSYLHDIVSIYDDDRIRAANWLGFWSRGGKEIDLLYRLARQDPSLLVRAAARAALTKIHDRLG